jgi:hypothetical protein
VAELVVQLLRPPGGATVAGVLAGVAIRVGQRREVAVARAVGLSVCASTNTKSQSASVLYEVKNDSCDTCWAVAPRRSIVRVKRFYASFVF